MKIKFLKIRESIRLITVLTMFFALPALAQTSDFTVTGGAEGTDWEFNAGVLTIKTGTAITIANTAPATPTTNRIVVSSGATANITLNGVNINITAAYTAAFDMTGSTVNLTLEGTNTLKSGLSRAGLEVPAGATLVITALPLR